MGNKGAIITVALCTCGHGKLLHSDSEKSGAECHGECIVQRCYCTKFTWTDHTEKIQVKNTPEAWKHWGEKNFEFL